MWAIVDRMLAVVTQAWCVVLMFETYARRGQCWERRSP